MPDEISPATKDPKFSLSEGLFVETIDGRRVGVVADVGDGYFLTKRRRHEDFWLSDVFVRSVGARNVVLHVDSRGLKRYTPRERPIFRMLTTVGLFTATALTTMFGFGV